MQFSTSSKGRSDLEGFEGCVLHAYRARVNGRLDVPTIGFGHTGPDVYMGLVWTQEQADAALSRRLAEEFEPAVNDVCEDVPTTQGQFDAMVCLAYNIGVAGFERSEVAKQHRLHNWDAAADAFEHWDHVNGRVNEALHNRRVAEAQVYLDASPVRPSAVDDSRLNRERASSYDGGGGGPIMTPMGSDPIGHQKLLPPAVATGLVAPALWWARVRHGLDLPAEIAVSFVNAIVTVAVWWIPHGLQRRD